MTNSEWPLGRVREPVGRRLLRSDAMMGASRRDVVCGSQETYFNGMRYDRPGARDLGDDPRGSSDESMQALQD